MPYSHIVLIYFICIDCKSIDSIVYVHCGVKMDVIMVIMFMTLLILEYVLYFSIIVSL